VANLKRDLVPISDWVEYELDVKPEILDPPKIRIKVSHLSIDEIQDHFGQKKVSAAMREMIADAIVEWDLQLEGVDLPCTAENKKKYLRFLVGLRVKSMNGKEVAYDQGKILDGLFGLSVLSFAGDPENFLKN
jgi:hypothetical protein